MHALSLSNFPLCCNSVTEIITGEWQFILSACCSWNNSPWDDTVTLLLSFSLVCLLQPTWDSGALGSPTKGASRALGQFWGVSVACFIVHKGGQSWEGVYGTSIEEVRRTSWPFAAGSQLMLGSSLRCKERLGYRMHQWKISCCNKIPLSWSVPRSLLCSSAHP